MDDKFFVELGEQFDFVQMNIVENVMQPIHKCLGRKDTRLSRLTSAERKTLSSLHYGGDLCVGDLKTKTGISNISKILTSLEGMGYIERCFSSSNKRFIMIHITESGLEIFRENDRIVPEIARKVLSERFSDEELVLLDRKLREINEMLKKSDKAISGGESDDISAAQADNKQ